MSNSLPNVGAAFSKLNPPMDPRMAGRVDDDTREPAPRAPQPGPAVGSALAALNPPVCPAKALATPCDAAGKVVTE